jgi:hypothetical protein
MLQFIRAVVTFLALLSGIYPLAAFAVERIALGVGKNAYQNQSGPGPGLDCPTAAGVAGSEPVSHRR